MPWFLSCKQVFRGSSLGLGLLWDVRAAGTVQPPAVHCCCGVGASLLLASEQGRSGGSLCRRGPSGAPASPALLPGVLPGC